MRLALSIYMPYWFCAGDEDTQESHEVAQACHMLVAVGGKRAR